MPRFIAVEQDGVWRVSDQQWKELYQKEDMPVRLYFSLAANAAKVADILNEEWRKFLRNPT